MRARQGEYDGDGHDRDNVATDAAADGSAALVTVSSNGRKVTSLTGRDIDLNRSQGDVGLFVPDAGYPFGEIPDWLIRQRIKVPGWESDRVKAMRAGGGK